LEHRLSVLQREKEELTNAVEVESTQHENVCKYKNRIIIIVKVLFQ